MTISEEKMSIASIQRGVLPLPLAIVLYGTDGVGKTTFASDAPKPAFLGTEMGTAYMADVSRFPQPENWRDVLAAIRSLQDTDHDRETLVIDTLDWLEPHIFKTVCDKNKVTSIEHVGGGFGKGYTAACEEWRLLLRELDALRAPPRPRADGSIAKRPAMGIILLAHSCLKMQHQADTDDYERYQLAINQKAADLVRQWSDVVLFAQHKTFTVQRDRRAKGLDGDARIVSTSRRAAFDAKNRLGLPQELPLDYVAFTEAVRAGIDGGAMRASIEALFEHIPDAAMILKARESLKSIGNDGVKLSKLRNILVGKCQVKETNQEEEAVQ